MPSRNIAEGSFDGTDGVGSLQNDHPVLAIKGRFASLFLMPEHPSCPRRARYHD